MIAAISRRAGPERRIWKRGSSGTAAFGGELRQNLVVDVFHELIDLLIGVQHSKVPTIDRVEALFSSRAKPFDLRPVFLFALLQQTQPLAHDLASVAETAG